MIETDVLIVGAGPAGLATAIKVRREDPSRRVVVLDKGRSPGSHVLSGAIVDPSGFDGFLTKEERDSMPCGSRVVKESFRSLLTEKTSVKIPWVPPMMRAKGYPVVSLTKLTAWLCGLARKLGAEVYTGYAVTELIEEKGRIVGARTGAKGVDKAGCPRSNYLAPEEIRAHVVVLAEGGCGILTEKLIAEKNLQGARPQTYALAVKELIEVPAGTQCAGEVMHTFGWPSDFQTYGGGFVYHVSDTQVMVGYAYALDYARAEINPFELFRRFKASTAVSPHIQGGKAVAYGAKVIPEGGFYSVPTPYTPGCVIVGDGAGLLDSLRIKGVHLAFQSAVAAAEAIVAECQTGAGLDTYPDRLKRTTGWKELKRVRNVRAGFSWGMPYGVAAAGLAWATFGKFPWFRVPGCEEGDAAALCPLEKAALAREGARKVEPGPLQPDRLTAVFMSGTIHEEDQPCHLKVRDASVCATCAAEFGAPCQRFCPADVYRWEDNRLQIDFSNCLHCKTCRIKCPHGNIDWTFPQGGDGPRYTRM